MARNIFQFRYYNDESSLNWPRGAKAEHWAAVTIDKPNAQAFWSTEWEGQTPLPDHAPIIQLGIQTIPGTKFYLNGSKYPTTIGVTGIYEINVEDGMTIDSLAFNKVSMERINENDGAYLIVDILVGEEES